MTQLIEDMASAQAAGICALSRMRGLPGGIPNLIASVVQIHPDEGCAWCAYPVRELAAMCGAIVPQGGVRLGVSRRDEKAWWAMPGKARLAAIRAAQADPA